MTEAAIVAPAPAPAPDAPNIVALELLGSGLTYSLGYERLFRAWSNSTIGIRAGGSFFTYAVNDSAGSGNLTILTFPLVASQYFGRGPHKLVVGLGATFLYVNASSDSSGVTYSSDSSGFGVAATGVLGWRYVPRDGGPAFGVAFTPMVRTHKGFLPWGGANVGYAF